MLRFFKITGLVLAFAGAVNSASAFALLGPLTANTWQAAGFSYNVFNTDIGGPMNIGEEYRWNVKTIYYAFDPTFVNYFGPKGVSEVNKAIAMLNSLPAMSKTRSDLTEFPTDTRRINYQAKALQLLDLKSMALAFLLEEMGLASPERYVWTIMASATVNTTTYYTVVQRNFNPTFNPKSVFISPQPSRYVNDILYTYSIQSFTDPTFVDAVELVRPSTYEPLAYSAVITLADGNIQQTLYPGEFFTGLTRDDVGSLRYLYRRNNFNVENLTATTNGVNMGSAWTPVDANKPIVGTALRPGVEKIIFKQARFVADLGQYFVPVTNTFTDMYVPTNSYLLDGKLKMSKQKLRRAVVQPDILFSAAFLGFNSPVPSPVGITRTIADGTAIWVNNGLLNASVGVFGVNAGPGQITPNDVAPAINIAFNNVGWWVINATGTDINYMDEGNVYRTGWGWGSFDGTTNAPVIYPFNQ